MHVKGTFWTYFLFVTIICVHTHDLGQCLITNIKQ